MSSENKTLSELVELFVLSFDGRLSARQEELLNQRLLESSSARTLYQQFLTTYVGLIYLDGVFNLQDSNHGDCDDLELWQALAAYEKTAPTVEIPNEKSPQEIIQKVVYPPKEKRSVSKLQIVTLVLSVAAILIFGLFVRFAPEKTYTTDVATLVDQINVTWADSEVSFSSGDRLWTNQRPIYLDRGIIEIQYDSGVDVTVEGPAKFAIERSGLYIEYGRLYSYVPQSGLGFWVETPAAQFIDQGTEFGIQADVNGSAELHVIKGRVQLFAGSGGSARLSQIVTENGAVKYNASLNQLDKISIDAYAFARSINSNDDFIWRGQTKYNLADVVGGGDGFGKGKLNFGIDHEGQTNLLDNIFAYTKPVPFTLVSSNPFVDGVFVPYTSTQITSSGQVVDFRSTSGGFYLGILNGAWHKQRDNAVPRHQLRLGGVKYGTLKRPAIYTHANQGITFDLQAIREYTNMEIKSFTAKCGVSESYGDYAEAIRIAKHSQRTKVPKASFHILVDGQKKSMHEDVTYLDEPAEVSVDIAPQDRFLTLATTESSDGNDGDWTLFGEPVLILKDL